MKVLVLGASHNPERYSYLAINRLLNYGHEVLAIGLRKAMVKTVEIQTEKVPYADVHTVTLYMNPMNQQKYIDYILALKPKRVIFNPGTENPEFEAQLRKQGAEAIEGCTLVMLSAGMF